MKPAIHPEQREAMMTCGNCGTSFELRSTSSDLTLDTCSHCHPAYTGRPARALSGNRVERFERRRELASR